jgi:hypothetical protein
MRRQLVIYVSVIVAVLVVALPVVVTMHSITVTGEGSYGMNSGKVYLGNVQAGQSVNGWFSFSDNAVASEYPPHFFICDPNGWELNNTNSVYRDYTHGIEGKNETFAFTAIIGGNWSAYVSTSISSGGPFSYSYTVGPTPVLGLGRVDFIDWVIAGGVIVELAVFLFYRRKKANMPNKS